MNVREQGFLLLTSYLGDSRRKVLSTAQVRTLTNKMRGLPKPAEDRDLEESDLLELGYSPSMARRILELLAGEEQLHQYLQAAHKNGCAPLTRITGAYPVVLHQKLGAEAPGCLWYKGDLSILQNPGVALVGSRDLNDDNLHFAKEVGKQAALQGICLISGNARGADRAAQESCLAWGGKVISIVADELQKYYPRKNILYLSEEGFDLPFSAQRALNRNRIIHCLGEKVFVAQSSLYTGGTWRGTEANLQKRWTPVYCFYDRSEAVNALTALGAAPIQAKDLEGLIAL